jgi:ribosomal protein S18 acetylase RimI-like enzyme
MNMISGPLSQDQRELMSAHVRASVLFLKHISIPEAPGWPFQPDLKYSCVHEKIAVELLAIGVANDALSRHTIWNLWVVDTSSVTTSISKPLEPLPEGYSICRVPANQIDTVISTSSVLRQASTYLQLPSMAILDAKGILVAWGYIGPDGTLATLFVQPDFRGKGFAKIITVELLDRLYAGDFIDMGFDGSTGWAHSNVYDGNVESEAVMMAIGGKKICTTSYIWIDSDRF